MKSYWAHRLLEIITLYNSMIFQRYIIERHLKKTFEGLRRSTGQKPQADFAYMLNRATIHKTPEIRP